MFNKKLLGTACLTATFGLGATAASAAPYLPVNDGNPLDADYVQLLEDDFYEILIEKDANGDFVVKPVTADTVIEVGDIFAGVLRVQGTETVDPTGDDTINLQDGSTFTQIFLIETLTSEQDPAPPVPPAPDGSSDSQTFGAVDAATWEAVFGSGGLLDICQEAAGVCTGFDIGDLAGDGTNTQVSEGTMSMLFNGVNFPDTTTLGDLDDSATTFVQGGTLQYEFGFTGAGGAAATGEFWETTGIDSAYPALSATNKPSVSIAMNVTQQWAGPNLEAHTYRQSVFDARFTEATQIQLVGSVASTANGVEWGVLGDIDAYIRPVPAPAPLALIALGLVGIGLSRRRRGSAI